MTTGSVLPRLDADSSPFWTAALEGRLLIQYCSSCDTPRFYPRLLCPSCHSDDYRWEEAGGAGVVYSYSVVHRAPSPSFAANVPYVVALIDLDEGVRMMSNVIADPSEVGIGDRVRVRFRPVTDEVALPEFVLERSVR